MGLLVTVIVVGAGSSFYIWYCQFGNDRAPDSLAGYSFAIAGTLCTALATTLYAIRRRSQKLTMGQLNAALNWHVFFAVMGIAFLLMHSFGNFHAKTGTYALYGLITLIVSGCVGRVLDRFMPWLIAREVDAMLTVQGDDRIEDISHSSTLIIQAKQQVAEIRKGERAMQREQFYRYVIRYWRGFHVGLALLTISLIIWHLIYVGELILNAFMRHGRM